MFASHHRSAITGLAFELLSEELRAIMSAKQRHWTKASIPSLWLQNPHSASGLRSASHRDSHFSLSVIFFRHARGCDHERPAMASFAVAQSLAGHEHLTVIVTFSLPANVLVRPCVHIMFRARAPALNLSVSQVACHPGPARARDGQFSAWLCAALEWHANSLGEAWTLRLARLACAGLLLSSVSALAGPKIVSGPGADPACFKPWS